MAILHLLLREVGGKFYCYPEKFIVEKIATITNLPANELSQRDVSLFFAEKGGSEWHEIHTVEPVLAMHDTQVAHLMMTTDEETKQKYLDPSKQSDAIIEACVSQWTLDKGTHKDWTPTMDGVQNMPLAVARVVRLLVEEACYSQEPDPAFTPA